MTLTNEQIMTANDRPREWVAIPEWTPDGGTHNPEVHGVFVRTMSAGQRDAWEHRVFLTKGETIRVDTVIACTQDAEGKPLFKESDANWLKERGAIPITRIFDVAARLSSLTKKDQ